ncbi:MAG: MATE family efflux transporter, partial [Cellulosilyticaceae bacterium]
MNKNIDLLNGNIYQLTFKFLLSSILGTLAVSFYILFDTIFIGQAVGGAGLAALNICLPVYTLLSSMGLLFGMGGGAAFSLALGKKDTALAHKSFSLSLTMGLIVSLLFTGLGVVFLEDIALLLGATPDILSLVTEYMKYLFFFAPSFMLVHILTVFMRNNNAPHIAMLSTIASGIVNIILDIIFLFVFDMGMAGAALATCLSSILSLSILTVSILKKPGNLKLCRTPFDL